MSLSFSVAHNKITKKVTCPRTSTVNQLASLATAKFGLPSSTNGTLLHGGKKLDGLLPLRLTNLVNNAKLVLEVSSELRPVTVKIIASVLGDLKQKIVKTKTDSSVQQLVEAFAAESGVDFGENRVQLSVLDARIDNGSTDFASTSLGSIIGSADNAVVRLTVENKDAQSKREKLQAEQRELRQQLEEHKRQARLLEKKLREDSQETNVQVTNEEELEDTDVKQVIAEKPEAEFRPETEDVDMDLASSGKQEPIEKVTEETDNVVPSSHGGITENASKEPGSVSATPSEETFEVQHFKEDTVYIPQNRSQHYENPDSDYNLTVAQAEKYYGIIKSMQQNKKHQPKDVAPPKAYIIRVRFPDRALLDLQIEDSSMKFGQLLKKLDAFVHEKHINTYKLKNSVPPFEEISMGFDANNTELKHHKSFQDERILLIWESTQKSAKGPFLKRDVNTRSIDDMPTLQLETHRGQLGEEEEKRRKSHSEPSQGSSEKKKKNGMPKWFKPGK